MIFHRLILPTLLSGSLFCLMGCGLGTQPMISPNAVSANVVSSAEAKVDVSLDENPVTAEFTVAVSPTTISIAEGASGSVKITTSISAGYDHSLQLTVGNLPAGVAVTLVPAVIPAPGSGSATATITVGSSVAAGKYTLHVKATDGKTTAKVMLSLKVTSSTTSGVTFKGCWYQSSGHRYQAVDVSVKTAGTYTFDAVLYSGTTCSVWADEFGFGQNLSLGGSYTFWFTDFADQTSMSALWHVGSSTSQCVNYTTAPDC